MKKLILVLICIAILLFFVAFNYLIWDRDKKVNDIENLKWTNANNISNINYLTRQIETLQEEKKALDKNIAGLQEDIEKINGNLEDAAAEIEQMKTVIAGKEETIGILKDQADPDSIYSVIEKWVAAMNEADFGAAHEMQYSHPQAGKDYVALPEFQLMYADKLQEIQVVSAVLLENAAESGKELPKIFVFEVELNAAFNPETATESLPGQLIASGENKLRIKMDFDETTNEWFIADMYVFEEPVQP